MKWCNREARIALVWILVLLTPPLGCSTEANLPSNTTLEQVERSAPVWGDAIARSRAAMEEMIAAGRTPGAAAAVAVDGELVWSDGFGYADVEREIEANRTTRFGIGSISKTLTTAAVMTAVDEGLLDLDTPIENYLSDWPHAGKGITVRNIAVHQSGLSDQFAVTHYESTAHFPTVDSAYQEIKNEKIEYQPGTRTVYATGLYTIIGRVIEAVTGQPYLEAMEQRVFEPSGMIGVVPNDPTREDLEHTQFYVEGDEEGTFTPGPPFDSSHKLAGAGFLARAEDLVRFGSAVLEAKIVSEQARDQMFRAVPLANSEATPFALGFRVSGFEGEPLIHQPGGGIGISSWLFILPERDLVVAMLSNLTAAPVGGDVAEEIIKAFSSN